MSIFLLVAYLANALQRRRRGIDVNAVKLLLAGVTGWFWWYCGRLSTNLLVGVAMFEIYHALQYNAIVWIYNRRLLTRAGERFGPLGFLFRDRLTMLGLYLGAIAAYSSIRYFTASTDDRMFSGDLAGAHQWLIAAFVTSSLLHFYYDGFIWKVSEPKTQQNLVDESVAAAPRERFTPGLVHLGKWGALAAVVGLLVAAERQFAGPNRAEREAAQRRALATLTPAVPEAAMLGSQEALARGDSAAAADLARDAAAARPDSHQSQAELAWALMEAGDFAAAKDALMHAIELAPGHWQYHCDLGEACEWLDELDRAQTEYLRAAKLAPKETEPLDRLAALLLRRNQIAAAVPALQRSLELDGDVAESHYRLGLAYLQQGNAARALVPLREATRLNAKHFRAWLQLGDALAALAKPQAAVGAYQQAVALRPKVADARVGLADALLSSGQAAEAERVLREGLARTPDSPELNLTLGVLLQQTGDAAEARALLRRAEELGMDVGAVNSTP
jgi:tetratricopeptide (TPR) repeat protein